MVWNYEERGICNVLCDCCVTSDVGNDAMCCDVRCGGGVSDVKSRCGGLMRCGIWWWCEMSRDVECGCGVE